MALKKCEECGEEISMKAEKCPKCGSPQKKKTSLFTWIITIILFLWIISLFSGDPSTKLTPQTTQEKSYPASHYTYKEINTEIGCGSKFSDDKKEDIFKTKFKNKWFIWSGTVKLAESTNASLDIDNFGTQDLRVTFVDPKAGYNLIKGSTITVKFLMKSVGGCFLPFSGDNATIL